MTLKQFKRHLDDLQIALNKEDEELTNKYYLNTLIGKMRVTIFNTQSKSTLRVYDEELFLKKYNEDLEKKYNKELKNQTSPPSETQNNNNIRKPKRRPPIRPVKNYARRVKKKIKEFFDTF